MAMKNPVGERPLSDEEARRAFGEDAGGDDEQPVEPTEGPVEQAASDTPEWASQIPPTLKIPIGVQVTWIRVRANWTSAPQKGDRVLLCWPLNEIEEAQAVQRSRGDSYKLTSELAKASLRLVDGHLADRTGTPGLSGAVATLWRDLGPKGRSIVRTYYTRAHTMSDEETQDFFLHCIASRTAAPG
jgi:hypothetical protein